VLVDSVGVIIEAFKKIVDDVRLFVECLQSFFERLSTGRESA
jgi:hypothetical protein